MRASCYASQQKSESTQTWWVGRVCVTLGVYVVSILICTPARGLLCVVFNFHFAITLFRKQTLHKL